MVNRVVSIYIFILYIEQVVIADTQGWFGWVFRHNIKRRAKLHYLLFFIHIEILRIFFYFFCAIKYFQLLYYVGGPYSQPSLKGIFFFILFNIHYWVFFLPFHIGMGRVCCRHCRQHRRRIVGTNGFQHFFFSSPMLCILDCERNKKYTNNMAKK